MRCSAATTTGSSRRFLCNHTEGGYFDYGDLYGGEATSPLADTRSIDWRMP